MNDKALANIAQEEFLLLRAKERATQGTIYKVIKKHFLKRNPFKSKKEALEWLDLIADSFAAKRQHQASTYKVIRACHRHIKALERLLRQTTT